MPIWREVSVFLIVVLICIYLITDEIKHTCTFSPQIFQLFFSYCIKRQQTTNGYKQMHGSGCTEAAVLFLTWMVDILEFSIVKLNLHVLCT